MNAKNVDGTLLTPPDVLRTISAQDFLHFGLSQIAYIKPIMVEGKDAFAVHAADGTPLSVTESFNAAITMVRHNDLEPIVLN